jgi:hypothetical protein
MFGRTSSRFMMGAAVLMALLLPLSACSTSDQATVIAASPTAITITTIRFTEPTAIAEAHCAKYGLKAVSQGPVKLGSVGYRTMWGYDCVKP